MVQLQVLLDSASASVHMGTQEIIAKATLTIAVPIHAGIKQVVQTVLPITHANALMVMTANNATTILMIALPSLAKTTASALTKSTGLRALVLTASPVIAAG
jgi:hypothetical protein